MSSHGTRVLAKSMKIAIVNTFLPPRRGGTGAYAYSLAKALAAKGHIVKVFCGCDPLPPGEYRQDGFMVGRLPTIKNLYGTPIIPALASTLHRQDVDVIHANFPSPQVALIAASVAYSRRIPAVLTWHNDLPVVSARARFLIEIHDRFILPGYLRAYSKIISTTETYTRQSPILRKLDGRVTIVTNGVDCERYTPELNSMKLRKELSLGDRFTVLFVGALTRWHRYKGLDVLLQALRLVLREEDGVVVVVVGGGDLEGYYRSITKELDMEDKVIFAGNISDEQLPLYYAACNVLALPSKDMTEGFGLVLLEANAAGRPVIASDVGGIPSVVTDGLNGLLISPDDSAALAHAIVSLLRNPQRAWEMGIAGRRIAELHDWKMVASQTETVYRAAMDRQTKNSESRSC